LVSAKCPDCDAEILIPESAAEGEILSCPSCGLELEVKKNGESFELQEIAIEGEDWGE
jgi:alpha-aminoadipate carrier protein LysW